MKKPWEEDYGLSNEIKPWELDYSKPIETSSQQQEPPKIEQPSGLEAFLNKGKIPTREEKRAIELAPPGVLGDTSYGHALYGSIKTGLAGLLGTKDGELTPGALRVLEEGRKEDIYPTMGDVIDAYNQEGFLPAAQKFAEATPYTLVRTAPQIAAGAAASVLAPELAIGAGLTRLGLGPAAEFAGGMIPRAIATYPTQVPFNYSGNILEQQQARESQAAKGETPTPISPERALEGAAAQSVIDALIAGRFTGGVSKLSPAELLAKAGERGTFKEAAARVGKSALEAGLENIIAEPVQEVIARAQANEELTSPEAIRAYEEAALSGAPMAAAGVPKGLLEVSAPEKARQQLSSAAERADEILNPSIGTTPPPLSQDEFKAYGELMAHAKHAQTLGIEGFEKTPDEFYKELESRVGVEPEQLHDMSLQKPSEQAQEVGTEQPAPIEQSQQIAPSGVSFTTAKGSTYQVNDNGTTTRNKSYHPEHGVEDQGEQPTSHQTVYVDRAGLNKLGMFQSVAPDGLVHQLVTDNGMAAIRRVDATTGQASPEYRQSVTQVHSEPAVGLYPVEIWDNGGTVHFGNKITNVETPQVESYWNKYTHPITNKPYSDMSIDELHTLKDNASLDKLKKDSGFVISQLGRKHFVVKNPTQIKSATGNQGTFNPEEADIRKSETAAPVENPHTAESLQEALAKRYGNNAPKINLGSLADVGNDTLVQGYYHPDTGVTLIPEDIDQSKDLHGLIRHEVAVHAQRLGKTDQEFQAILTQLQALRDKGAKAIQEAYARVPKDTAPDLVHEEALGYLVEYAKQLPIVQRFMSWLRRTAYKLTGSAKWLKENDFAKMADEVLKKQPVKNVGKEAAYSKRNDNWSTEEVDSLRQKIDKISDKAKEVVLKAPSIAGIYDIATDKLLPGGKKIIEQLRIMNAEQRHNVTKAADKIKQLHEWMAKDFTKKHILDEVTSEATLLGARPDNAAFMQNLIDGIAVNKPEGYQETLARLSKLQSDWSRLGKSGQSMYKMMRDSYQDTLAEMYDAMKDNVRKLTSLSNEEKESRIRDLDEQLSSIKLKGDYFPILRYGNWGVTYKENNETKYTKFETERQAKEFVKKLEDAGEEGYLIKDTDEIRNVLGVDTADFNKLYTDVKTLGEEGAPDVSEIKDLLFQTYLMSRPERSISKRFMHRKGTAGYSNDAIRAFAKHSLSMANQVPRIKHGREVLDGVRSMKHRLPKSGKENALSQYYYEAFKREAENVINPVPTDPIAGFLTQFGFDAYLTSVASAVNQMASVPALALPAIAKKHGLINAQSALNTATQWYVESGANKKDGWWNIARGIDKTKNVSKVVKGAKYANDFDPKDAYQQFLDNGIIDSTLYMQAFEAGSKPTGAHEDVLDRAKRIMNIVAIPFGQMESASRQIASMGAYIAGMKSGMHHQQAVEYAINLIYRDMGDYGPTGRSKLSKSTLGRIGYQFQQYSSKLFHSIGMSVRDIFSNNPEERTIAIKHLGGLYAMHYLLAGALGLPGAGLVGSIVDEIEDLLDEDEWHSYEANLKSWLNKKLPDNEVIQNIILEGPLATALGVDLKSRLGAQDILPLFRESEMNDGIVKKSAEKLGQMASGIPSVGAIGAALDHYEAERYGKALTGLIPNAQIKSIASAYRYATEGKVTPKGGEVISPKEITKADVAKRAIGYEPLTTSQKSTAAREQGAENRFLSTRKSKIQEQLVESIVKDDKAAKDKALKMIEKFSNKNPSYAFDSDEITSAVRNRYKYLQTNLRGQNVPLKQMQYYLDKVPHLRK